MGGVEGEQLDEMSDNEIVAGLLETVAIMWTGIKDPLQKVS